MSGILDFICVFARRMGGGTKDDNMSDKLAKMDKATVIQEVCSTSNSNRVFSVGSSMNLR